MTRSTLVALAALVSTLITAPLSVSRAQDAATGNDARTPPYAQGPVTPADGTPADPAAPADPHDTSTTPPPAGPAPAAPSLSHRYQVGLRAGLGVPFVFGLKYKDGPACDDAMQEWCRHFGVGMLDLDLGFGVSNSIEVSFSGRFGLADEEAAHAAPVSLGLGVRAYGSPESTVKPFFGPRLILDLTSSPDRPEWKSVDIGLRAEVGLQVDFLRYLGAYGQLGLTLSFLRALMFVPDVSIGVQVRLP